MKKIFTFIISTVLFTSAFAQYNGGDQRSHGGKDVTVNDNRYKDNYSFNKRERDIQIMKINREYDHKIQAVKDKLFMNRFKKVRIIAMLEDQRNDEIKKVYAKFNNRHGHYDDKKSNDRW